MIISNDDNDYYGNNAWKCNDLHWSAWVKTTQSNSFKSIDAFSICVLSLVIESESHQHVIR